MAKYIDDNLRFAIEAAQPFKDALAVLDTYPHYAQLVHNPSIDRIDEVKSALKSGIFDLDLASRLEDLYQPFEEHQLIAEALGNSLIRPNYYEGISKAMLSVADRLEFFERSQALQNMTVGLSAFSAGVAATSKSWIHDPNIWGVSKSTLSVIETAGLGGGAFSALLKLEQETSLIPGIERLTCVTSQIASIQDALGLLLESPNGLSRLLSDFAGFATNQHLAIQRKAGDEKEVAWRLDALEAASKLVDRQVKWSEAIIDAIPDEDIVNTEDSDVEPDASPSVISMLPQHIAYSKRRNVVTTPVDALENSTLVEITEKGKAISEKIVLINKLCEDSGNDRLFKYTDKVVSGVINMSTMVCSTEVQLGSIIDVLYFVFYENVEHIKTFIGGGDNKAGDQKVRNEDVYQCIFNVKTIRSDLRHDLDHGKDKEIRKKLMNVGDCYKHYCNKRPIKAKDYKLLQLRLYGEFLSLTNSLVEMF